YVSSSPNQIARIDRSTLALVDTVQSGSAPDGVDYDPDDRIVGVSDQGDGALSLLADDGDGAHTEIPLGTETGNVRYDAGRGWFWIAVEQPGTDQLVAVDPKTGKTKASLDLPGCDGAHGLRFHPDGQSAFVACEGNDVLVRVEIDGGATSTGPTTLGPDVLSI